MPSKHVCARQKGEGQPKQGIYPSARNVCQHFLCTSLFFPFKTWYRANVMQLPIVTGDEQPILRKVITPVTEFDEKLLQRVQDMAETMTTPEPGSSVRGVGLAANQVGIDQRIILITLNIDTRKEQRILAMINPEILELSGHEVWMEEGCLSLPGQYAKVKRPSKVCVRWQNEKGEWCERKFDGWDARIFLHEYDHLEGKLFTDYLTKKSRMTLKREKKLV